MGFIENVDTDVSLYFVLICRAPHLHCSLLPALFLNLRDAWELTKAHFQGCLSGWRHYPKSWELDVVRLPWNLQRSCLKIQTYKQV